MKVKRIAFVVHVSECFWRPSEFLRTCWDIIRREELGFPHIASPHYTHLALMCHELPGKPYTHTPVHTHTTACMPQLSFFLFISFPFQNRQRNGHSISNGRLTKDISWSANLTKCLYLEISYGPNRKSGGDTVTQLQIIDLWRQISWIIQKKKKNTLRAESSSLYLSLIQLTGQTPNPHFVMLWESVLLVCTVKVLLGSWEKSTLWYYQQFFSFWLVMIITFVCIVNT